jgi:hypothetical protein
MAGLMHGLRIGALEQASFVSLELGTKKNPRYMAKRMHVLYSKCYYAFQALSYLSCPRSHLFFDRKLPIATKTYSFVDYTQQVLLLLNLSSSKSRDSAEHTCLQRCGSIMFTGGLYATWM